MSMYLNFIQKPKTKNQKFAGQGLIEIIVAMAVFSLIASVMMQMVLGGFLTMSRGGEHTVAEALAQEGIEAVRAVRDRDWDSLNCANCVVSISEGEWILSEGVSEVIGEYQRIITIGDVYRDDNNNIAESGALDPYTKLVTVTTSWTVRDGIVNTVTRTEYLTNWEYPSGGECLNFNTDNACLDDTDSMKGLINLTLSNTCVDDTVIISSTPTWNIEKNIENITIDGVERWDWNCDWNCAPTGRQTYGTELDFGDNNLIIPAGTTVNVNQYRWNGNMSGMQLSILFLFDDDTVVDSGNFSPPDCASSNVNSYCQGLGYSTGTCRANSNQCTSNGEIYESGGDGYCTGGGSDTACCLPATDINAPDAITDLALSGATQNSIDLSWTAPGDDGMIGIATGYDVRYSTAEITEGNWDLATQASGEPSPSIAGSSESMTVSGLTAGTIYYFVIKTSDEVPNESDLSNVPSLSTTGLILTTIFEETFPNSDSAWNGSSDTAQDESGWSVIQGNGDSNDIKISDEDIGSSPSGGNHLTFEDCDEGFYTPETYDLAYVAIDLSGYTGVTIEYYWQSDDVDGNEGMRATYSTNSTNGIDGTWTQIAEYINPSDSNWTGESFALPDIAAVASFKLRFSSKSNATSEHMYVDDVKLTGYQ